MVLQMATNTQLPCVFCYYLGRAGMSLHPGSLLRQRSYFNVVRDDDFIFLCSATVRCIPQAPFARSVPQNILAENTSIGVTVLRWTDILLNL